MNETRRHPLVKIIVGIWDGFAIARQFAWNVILVVILLFLIIGSFSSDIPTVEDGSALVVAPSGTLVEQIGGDPVDRAISKLMGREDPQTLIRDLIKAIELAAEDDDIELIVLRLDGMGGAGLANLRDIGSALDAFKSEGKKVIAVGDNFGTNSYYLASHADEIILHPMGMVMIEGYGRFGRYYKGLIDLLEVDWNVFKVGTFKSAVEPYIRKDMSDAAKEANLDWLGDLWETYKSDVAQARGRTPMEIEGYVLDFVASLREQKGDTAQLALAAGMVDRLADRTESRDYLISLVGEDDEGKSYLRTDVQTYLKARGKTRAGSGFGDGVGVIVASGVIEDGSRPPGTVGSDSTAALIRRAREDEKIKAVVLRVDSPGGSAFASEVILRELAKTREEGKPVVVSMGHVAASGGYWISTSSDEIWASPTTITGSIGIFGMFPTFQKTLAKVGITVDGVGTTPLSGALRPDRKLDPEAGTAIQLIIEQGYHEFITRVAEARGMTLEEVDKIGQGRVWSGVDAQRHGLVDKLGGLDEAIASAAALAELGDDYAIHYVEKELEFREKLIADLLSAAAEVIGPRVEASRPRLPGGELLDAVSRELETIERLNDPRGVYAYSPCDLR